jgi:hypothetical protein
MQDFPSLIILNFQDIKFISENYMPSDNKGLLLY